jgi:hypothetical protein
MTITATDKNLIRIHLNQTPATFLTVLWAERPKTTVLLTLLVLPLIVALLQKIYLWIRFVKVEQLCSQLYNSRTLEAEHSYFLNLEQKKIIHVLATRVRRVKQELSISHPALHSSVVEVVLEIAAAAWLNGRMPLSVAALQGRVSGLLVHQQDDHPTASAVAGDHLRDISSSEISLRESDASPSGQAVMELENQEPNMTEITVSLDQWIQMQRDAWSHKGELSPQERESRLSKVRKKILRTHRKLTRRLNLKGFGLTIFPAAVLAHMNYLERLNLAHNRIITVPHDGFASLRELRWLILGDNRIKRLENDTFLQLVSLERLNLHKNRIKKIAPGCLAPLKKLKKLVLSRNRIQKLPENFFANQARLQYLRMSDNSITAIDSTTLKGLHGLEFLDFSNNKIGKISSGSFDETTSLRTVDLSFNEIPELPEGIFGQLTKLKVLLLYGNIIRQIPVSDLPRLKVCLFSSEYQIIEKIALLA